MAPANLHLAFLQAEGDDAVVEALDVLAKEDPELAALMPGRLEGAIEKHWDAHLHSEVLDLEVQSTVGATCFQALMKCDLFTRTLQDLNANEIHLIRSAVGRQCNVWLFG